MYAPRAYIHHSTTTITFLKTNYHRMPMGEIAVLLNIPRQKLYELARREKVPKRKPNK